MTARRAGGAGRDVCETSTAAVHALLERVLGARAADVDVALVEPTSRDGADGFEVAASRGRVAVKGTSGVAIASGLRHYLTRACGVDLTWDGPASPALPARLPPRSRMRRQSPWRYRYHLNYCTFGYSTAFWDWSRWEREIDWMALHGVNLPLCLVGHEAIWLRTLQKFGMSDARARAFIGGPAFLPWRWMGCVHDHGEPVSNAWLDAHVDLGHRILGRQRSLGMTPVLPGFAGYVPEALAPAGTAEIDWMGFANHMLDPRDPLFREFGLALLEEQEREFGSDHFYAADPYIEGSPPGGDPDVLAGVAAAIAGTLEAHDPRSVWVLQGWPFRYRADFWTTERIETFLRAMPPEQTLVLDLWAEHAPASAVSSAFAGRPWLWCMLHSLGGRPGMYGRVDAVASEPGRLRGTPDGGQLCGVGTTMESLDRDPVLYELFADMVWQPGVISIGEWVDGYLASRYGRRDEALREAWQLLVAELYTAVDRPGPARSIVMCRPRLDAGLWPHEPVNLAAPRERLETASGLVRAWGLLVDSALERGATPGLARDIVDVGQEILARRAATEFDAVVDAYRTADMDRLARAEAEFVACLEDIDRLMSTRREYRLDTWLTQAYEQGHDGAERAALVRQARRLLTVWVAPGHPLQDYAGRHFAGLVSGYYLPRWRIWLSALRAALAHGHVDEARDLDVARFEADLRAFEEGWLAAPYEGPYEGPGEPPRDAAGLADAIRARHRLAGRGRLA